MSQVDSKPMVFFSHSSRDVEWVEYLSAQAMAAGVRIYLAKHDVKPGHVIGAKVIDAIKRSSAVLVLITESSLSSTYVAQEIGIAQGAGKLVIPVVMSEVENSDLATLTGVEYIRLDSHSPLDALQRISVAMQDVVRRSNQSEGSKEALVAVGAMMLVVGLMLLTGRSD